MKEEYRDKKSTAVFTARPCHVLYQRDLINTKKKNGRTWGRILKNKESPLCKTACRN